MSELAVLRAENTHLYPGARLHGDHETGPLTAAGEVVIVFSDHAHAEAQIAVDGDGFALHVQPHTTAAGTSIEARSWQLTSTGGHRLRIAARL